MVLVLMPFPIPYGSLTLYIRCFRERPYSDDATSKHVAPTWGRSLNGASNCHKDAANDNGPSTTGFHTKYGSENSPSKCTNVVYRSNETQHGGIWILGWG